MANTANKYKSVQKISKDKNRLKEVQEELRRAREKRKTIDGAGAQGQANTRAVPKSSSSVDSNRTKPSTGQPSPVDRRARIGERTKGQSYYAGRGFQDRGETKTYTYHVDEEWKRMQEEAERGREEAYYSKVRDNPNYANTTKGREERANIKQNNRPKYNVTVGKYNTEEDEQKKSSLKKDSSLNRYRGALEYTRRTAEKNSDDLNKWSESVGNIQPSSQEEYSSSVAKGRNNNPLRKRNYGLDESTLEYFDYLYGSGRRKEATEGVSLIQKSNKLSQNYKTQADEYENAALKSNQNIANNFNNEAKSIQQRIDDISSGKIKVSDPAGEISALNKKRAEYEAAGREYQGYADTNKYVTTNQVKMSKDPDVEAKIEAGKQKDTFLYTKDNADAYRVASSMGGLDDLETLRTAAMTMTEAELRQYYYTLAEDDEEAAINYLRTLYNDTRDAEGNPTGGLGQRFAEKFNEVRDKMSGQSTGLATLNKVFDYSHTFGAGATNAVVGLKDAGERLFASQIIGDNDVHLEGITQKIYQNNVQSGRVNKIAGDIVYNVGNMMPQIAVSIATGGVGAAPMVATLASSATVGLSSFGNTYQQARREGFDSTSATIYGVLNGVSEAGLQAALSGIAAKGFGVVTEDIVRNATDALKRTALSPVTKSILGTIITQSIDASGEFVEEYLQEILDPVFRNWALGEANEFQPFTSEALYAGFLGALSAGVMNSVSVANGYAQYVSEGKMQRIAVPELVEQGLSFAKTSEAYKSSEYFQNKLNNGEELTDLEVGLLAQQTEEQLAVENEINGYKYGDINWNTLSDQTRATLVNPENAAYLAEQFGFDVNENMSPDEMRAAIEQNAQESYAKENRRSFDDLVQEQLNNTESQEDINKINKTAEQNREIYTDAEQATGKEIVIADLDKGVNGFATADRIVLSSEIANTDEGARFVLAHEITHGTELSRHWSALLDSAKKFFGENWDTEVQRIQQLYSRDNPNFSIEQAEREVVADFVGKHVFTDIESMKNFIRDHKTTARRIMSWLKGKFTNTSGTDNAVLREAYRNFERAFNEIDRSMEGKRAAVQYQQNLATGVQFSVNRDQIIRNQKRAESATEDNRYVTEADEEDYMNTGKNPSVRHKKANEYDQFGSLLLKSKKEAADFIDDSIKNDDIQIVRPYGLVGKRMAQDILDFQRVAGDKGVDASGYYLEINSSDVHHAYKEHSIAKEEGDIPLSLADFENIPDYLDTYDDILDITQRGSTTRIEFGKKINGYSVIVTTVSTNRKSLAFKNMIGVETTKYENIKKSKPLRMETGIADNNSPTPQNLPAYSGGNENVPSSENIAQPKSDVNTGRQKSLSPIESAAIDNFGTTEDWNETGYITTDGSKLDFSGRHWNGGRDTGGRYVDHRDINEVVVGLDGSDAINAFMNEGAIRVMPETGGIELITEPTEAQLRQIANFARQNRGDVMLDVSDEDGRTIFSKDYAVGTNPSAVVSDIRNYFDNNAQPEDALFSRAQVAQETKQELASQDLDYDEATQSVSARQYSASSFKVSDYVTKKTEMARRMSETLSGVTQEQAEKWIDDVTGIANVIFGDQGRLDYATEYEGFSALRDNAEYDKTVDFSLICAKRRLYTGTMDLIRSMMPDAVLLGEDLARIRELMVAKGDEVACGTCYVETSRLQQDVYTSRFIEAYKESQRTGKPIQYTNSSGKQTELVSTKETGRKSFVADPMLNVTMESFLSTDSMNRIRNNYPDLALAYDTYMNRLGTAKPKAVETRIAYRHEILDDFKTAKRIERFNKTGGLRVNSFSDFETPHLIDMMQVVLDMASVGLKSHAYTKVPNFAWVFGDTGVKINCSLFGKGTGLDSNGNLVFDDVEGMPHEEAFKLRDNYSKNVGTILVGMNEAHIRAALADPRIDMVIPYHKSQMTDALAARFGLDNYQDYTSSQNEIDLKTGKKVNHNINVIFGETNTTLAEDEMVWDFSKSELENTQAYLDLCEELGRKPKFAEFLDKQGDKYIATKGYYKMLVDFKVYDNEGNAAPHEVVTPNFNMDEANRVLDEYEGGADNLPVDREVAEQFVAEFQQNKPGQTTARQYSMTPDESRAILENAQEAYGKKPAGENPVREHNVPNRTSENRFVSNYARTLYEAEATTDEMIPALDSGIAAEDFSYERISNAKLQKGADVILQNDGIESARKQWDGVAERSDAATPQDIALGQTLYNEYVKAGDYDNAIQVAMDLARKATTAGQTVQAFRLLKKLTPDGQLYTLEKLANDYNKQLAKRKIKGFKGIEIDENLAKQLLEAKTKTDIQAAREAIMQNIADQVPATWADKLNAWRYMSMLFNPRTHIRNIVGNAFFVPMRGFKDLIGAGMERAVQKAGGMTQEQRTKTVINPFDKSNKQYFDKAREAFDENVDIIRGEDKYGKSQIDQQRRIFKSRVLNWIDKFNSAMLEKEDVIFMKKAFVDSYAKAMKARGITAETMTAAQENEITDYAIREAQKATYRDANALATALNKFKQSNKFAHLIGEGLFPFTKTPLNILKRGIEYSPIGIIKGTYQALNGVRKGTTTAAEAIDSMASGISGTSILALGAWLASQGLIKGGSDDDNESALDSLQGGQSYSLVIGDKSYTLDWAAPVAMPLFIGVEMFNSFDKDNEGGANFSRIVDSITKISDPLFNLSMLSSLNSAIDTIKYNEGASALTEIGINVLTSYAGQYVPTISGQFARIIDENQRKTFYAKDSNLPKAIDSLWQGAVKKIPGLSMIMQPSIDRWGKEKKTENVTERVLENLVSPGYYSERSSDDVDREIDRLYVQIGDASVIPPAAEKSIKWTNFETKETGEMNLTAEQYTKYSKRLGSLAYEGVQDLIKSDAYKQLNDRERADAINEIYDYAKNIAKNEITGGKYQLKDWAQVLKDNNDVLGDYAIYKTKISGKDMGTKEKREMLQEMKMPDEVREQIYRASFSESDVEKLDEAEKKGARFNQFLSMKIAMDKIDESDSDSKNTDKKKWLINNISSEKSLTALWETFFETDSTAERNTLSYAKSQGVSVDSFMRREVQKTTEEADYSDATKQDYLYQIVNGEAQIVTDEKGVAVYGSKMKKALDHMLHSGYNEDELNYFYQREYGSDDTFVWARQAGMEARTYIEARDSTLMLSADKDENGKSISGTKKAKVADALNALATSRINKLIMFGKSYTLTTSQYQDIIDYVFDLSNLSNEEKLQVLEGLKIEVIDGIAYPRKAS